MCLPCLPSIRVKGISARPHLQQLGRVGTWNAEAAKDGVPLFSLAEVDAAMQLALEKLAERCSVDLSSPLDRACFTVAVLQCAEREHYTLYEPNLDPSAFYVKLGTKEPTLVTTGNQHPLPPLGKVPGKASYVDIYAARGWIGDPQKINFQVW